MGTEFDNVQGLPISLAFAEGTVSADSTGAALIDATISDAVFLVPTGMRFRPLFITVGLDGAVSAGSLRVYCRSGTTEIKGPEVTFTAGSRASDTARLHEGPGVAAGQYVEVAYDSSADMSGPTALSGILVGVLMSA